jgi:hypothetical protein
MSSRPIIRLLAFGAMLCALPLASADAQEAQSFDLRPMWQEGQTARYQVVTSRLNTIELSGLPGGAKKRQTAMRISAEATWQVLEVDPDGGGICRMTVEKMQMELTGPEGQKLSTSQQGGDKELQAVQKLIKALTDKPVELVIDSNGQIDQVRGFQAVQRAAGPAGEQLEERDFREMAGELAVVIGGVDDAKPGRTWRQKFKWSHDAGDLVLDSRYKLLGVEQIEGIGVAMINRESDIDIELDKSQMPPDAPIRVKTSEGKQTTQIMFDLSRHEVVGRNIDRKLEVAVQLSLAGRSVTQSIREQLNTQVLRIAESR